MTSRYEAYMDGVALSSLDPSIYVLDIHPVEPKIDRNFVRAAQRYGAVQTRKNHESAGVQIDFEIHEYNIGKRQAVCQKVQKWADGSVLNTSDREGQKLRCICEQYPTINSAKDWTETLSMAFTGYVVPFWEEINESTLQLTGTNESGTLFVPGNADQSYVSATIKANASVSSVVLGAGSTSMTLSNLSLSQNDTVTIDYDDRQLLRIRKGSTSLMSKRTGDDDLLVECGKTSTFTVTASGSVTVTFKVRGCWH